MAKLDWEKARKRENIDFKNMYAEKFKKKKQKEVKLGAHESHEIEIRKEPSNSAQFARIHCLTCDKFVTWIGKETYFYLKSKK